MKDLISKADPATRRHFMMQAASACLGVGIQLIAKAEAHWTKVAN